MRAGEAEMVAQEIHERGARLDHDAAARAVHHDLHGDRWRC
jgi:hypothetical protein